MKMDREIFITLGCGNSFNPEKFKPIENTPYFCKPHGGLWSSPENSTWGWKQWIESEMPDWMEKKYGKTKFRFHLKPGSKIYQIDNVIDLLEVPYKIKTFGIYRSCCGDLIDFEEMAKEYDGILLTENGQADTRWSDDYGMSLYGWDCESLLILRPDCIEEIA